MKNLSYILIILFIFTGCKARKGLQTSVEEVVTPKPTWIDNRPNSSAFYIGIGSSSKTLDPSGFAEAAKNNAFNDLVSEISVNIHGESFLQVLEVNYQFEEQFTSMITATSTERIEGFERMGTWQDEGHYYVYYRLSKSEHARIKKEMKDGVLSQAFDLYEYGREEEDLGDIVGALTNYLQALKVMEPYWNETTEYMVNNQSIHLDNLIYGAVLNISNGLLVDSDMEVVLSSGNDFQEVLELTIMTHGKYSKNIDVSYDYDRGNYMRRKTVTSNEFGKVAIPVRHPNIKNKDNFISIEIDLLDRIPSELKTGMMKAVVKNIKPIQKQIPIDLQMPSIYIVSTEKNMGEAMTGKMLSDALKNELIKSNFYIVASESTADYFIELGANTSAMGTSQGFHVCHLTFSFQVLAVDNGNVVFQKTESSIKGLQLNYKAAGIESYKKGVKKIKRDVVPEFIEILF